MTETTETLGEALPREMARVRDEVMPAYREIGMAGAPALVMMRNRSRPRREGDGQGDVVAMLRTYEELKGYSL